MSLNAGEEMGAVVAELRRLGSGSRRTHLLHRKKRLEFAIKEKGMRAHVPATPTHNPYDFDEKLTTPVARLRSIEREIDSDDMTSRKRNRLLRLRKGLRRKIAGKDPRAFAGIGTGGIPEEKRNAWEMKKTIINLLNEL